MMKLRSLIRRAALVAAIFISGGELADAQTYPGQFPASTIYGNSGGSAAVPSPLTGLQAESVLQFLQSGTGGATRLLDAKVKDYALNVLDFGATCNAITYTTNVSITSGTAAMTVSAGTFSAGDVGKKISVPGAGVAGAPLSTTISAVGGSASITLGANASTTLAASSQIVQYGSDDATAIQNAINQAGILGGWEVRFPGALCAVGTGLSFSSPGVRLVGSTGIRTEHDVGVLPTPYSGLVWVGTPAGSPIVSISPLAGVGAQRLNGTGVSNLVFHCGNNANQGLQLVSLDGGDYGPLSFFECLQQSLLLTTITSAGETVSLCRVNFRDIYTSIVLSTGTGIGLTGNTTNSMDTCFNVFTNTEVLMKNGIGILCQYADNNTFLRTFVFHNSGGTADAIQFSQIDGTHTCNGNHFYDLTVSNKDASGGNIHAYNNSNRNSITNLDSTNASPAPLKDSSATLWFTWDSVIPTISSGFCTSPSILNPGGLAFDIIIGSGCAGGTGTITMPAAITNWHCTFTDFTNNATDVIQQTGGTATTVTVQDYSRTTGVTKNFISGDSIGVTCVNN